MEPQRIVVVSGHPTDAELAAVTVALQRHRRRSVADAHPMSPWIRAARLEARGHPPIDAPTVSRLATLDR